MEPVPADSLIWNDRKAKREQAYREAAPGSLIDLEMGSPTQAEMEEDWREKEAKRGGGGWGTFEVEGVEPAGVIPAIERAEARAVEPLAAPSGMVRRAFARFASAPSMFSGDPVITVGSKRVTPVANIERMERAISSSGVVGEQ